MKTILVDAYNTFVLPEVGRFDDMYQLLETYANPKIILTNANDEQLITLKITDMPYDVFSMKHEPDKVNPVFYKTMLEKYSLSPEDVIYFEHNSDAVKSAQSVGITAYHYDKDAKDLVSLKTFIDTNL